MVKLKCGVCYKYVYRGLLRCPNCGYKVGSMRMFPKTFIKTPVTLVDNNEINKQLCGVYGTDY